VVPLSQGRREAGVNGGGSWYPCHRADLKQVSMRSWVAAFMSSLAEFQELFSSSQRVLAALSKTLKSMSSTSFTMSVRPARTVSIACSAHPRGDHTCGDDGVGGWVMSLMMVNVRRRRRMTMMMMVTMMMTMITTKYDGECDDGRDDGDVNQNPNLKPNALKGLDPR
jgi:hypothetical protein